MSALFFAIAILIGDPLPPLDLVTLDAHHVTLKPGRITVIDFFATWCEPCKKSLPAVERLRAQFGDRVDFIAIDQDEDGDTDRVAEFATRMKIGSRVLLDPRRRAYQALGAHVLPTTYIVDKLGVVRKINHGYGPGYEARMTGWLGQLLHSESP